MQRKVMITGGVVLLFLVGITAAFSVGVYIGRYGLTRDGLTLRGPGNLRQDAAAQVQQAQRTQQNQPAVELPGKPQVIGRIRRIHPDGLGLATADGPRLVLVDEETRYRDESGAFIERDELQEGFILAIFASPNGRQELRADLVVVVGVDQTQKNQ
ncbi:MAG: hypothetical protein JXA42_07250 [Anaerolineales bacterium]|nr:hypothetical protein [Anaerolineales bacterium]